MELINRPLLLKHIDDISKLEQNWNGYNAPPIEYIVVDNAKKVIDILKYQPDIYPTARNSIQIEYNEGKNRSAYLEIEVYKDKYTILIVYEHNYQAAFTDTITDILKLSSVIQPFFDIVVNYK